MLTRPSGKRAGALACTRSKGKATTTLNESQAARLEELAAKAGAATASNPAQKRQRHQKKQQHHYTEQQWADWKTKENKQKTQDKKD